MIAGFFILAEDQYRIGDTVTVAATTGKVEDIQFRVTVLRDGEGNVHYVPNGQITVTSNLTSLYASPSIDVEVGYQADVDRAMEVMLDELMKLSAEAPWSDMITKEPQMLGVQDLVGSGVLLRADDHGGRTALVGSAGGAAQGEESFRSRGHRDHVSSVGCGCGTSHDPKRARNPPTAPPSTNPSGSPSAWAATGGRRRPRSA